MHIYINLLSADIGCIFKLSVKEENIIKLASVQWLKGSVARAVIGIYSVCYKVLKV